MIDANEIVQSQSTLQVEFVIVPYDSGRYAWRMGAGPLALLASDLAERVAAIARTRVSIIEAVASDPLPSAVEIAGKIATAVAGARAAGRFPVVLAGNCFATVGAVAGLSSRRPGVVWLDAHGDLNTPETSPSGFLDGMAAATLLGWCYNNDFAPILAGRFLQAGHLLTVGARAFDPGELEHAERAGVRFSSGAPRELAPVLAALLSEVNEVFVHLDLDVLDPDRYGQANGFPEPRGVATEQILELLGVLSARGQIAGLTVSAYDPAYDPAGSVREAATSLITETLRLVIPRSG